MKCAAQFALADSCLDAAHPGGPRRGRLVAAPRLSCNGVVMKTRTTLILLALVVGGRRLHQVFRKQGPEHGRGKTRGPEVVNFERENLEGIVIQNGDDRIELRRTNDKWRLEAPIKDQADRARDRESDLRPGELEKGRHHSRPRKSKKTRIDWTNTASSKPKLRLKLLGKEMPPEILFGKDGALRGQDVCPLRQRQGHFLVGQTVRNDIAKKPEEFRDHKLTDLTTARSTRVAPEDGRGRNGIGEKGGSSGTS